MRREYGRFSSRWCISTCRDQTKRTRRGARQYDFLTGLLMLPLYGFLLEALSIMARNWVLVVPMALLTPTAMRWVAVEQQRESELDPANN